MPWHNNNVKSIGHVISVQGPVVDVKFSNPEDVPSVFNVINTQTVDKDEIVLEVAEHLPNNIARCIAINSTINLQRNAEARATGGAIQIPAGEALYGRLINMLGHPIDQKGAISSIEKLPIRKAEMGSRIKISDTISQG